MGRLPLNHVGWGSAECYACTYNISDLECDPNHSCGAGLLSSVS
jgi:hypothetical protein